MGPGVDRRAEVVRAAVALFAEQGYKETTASEIAQRAGISRRSFFYYFRSKDDVLFSIDPEVLERLTTVVAEQADELTDLGAVANAWKALGLLAGHADRSRTTQLRRAAEGSPVLRGKELELHLAYRDATARGLARRRGLPEPDDRARSAAAMGQSLMHLVIDQWIIDPHSDRDELIDRYFDAAVEAAFERQALDSRRRT